ncbi:hypothetical protein [Nocardioides sp. CFH 31398]|uniref:hypothetical protein n=1 Tax=Nocardioides sp. CFH 31398 TaxID=2919579 RepID=UPI001F05858B|nr:hypothetical protein [Nocardioides sp. CFH 31398]MCH1868003.1 hypothetical protein [Nocardioides sp. CFH 31398]
MRVGTLLLANAFLLAAMVVAYRASRRPAGAATRPDPTSTRTGRRLLAAALVCFAAHLVVLGVEGL